MSEGRLIRRLMPFERNYTTIPNAWVRDERLSVKALGILVRLLSHQDGWTVTLKALAESGPDGLALVRSAVEDLEQFGYLIRRANRRGRPDDWELCDPTGLSDPALFGYAGLRPVPVDKSRSKIAREKHAFENRRRDAFENRTSIEDQLRNNSLPSATTVESPAPVDKADAYGELLQVARTNDVALVARIIHQPCPMRRDGKEHPFAGAAPCPSCGIRPDQRWHQGDIAQLDDLLEIYERKATPMTNDDKQIPEKASA